MQSIGPSSVADARCSRPDRPPSKIQRRHRAVHSCFSCRVRKLKCDKQQPCKTCQKAGRVCSPHSAGRDESTRTPLREDKDGTSPMEQHMTLARENPIPHTSSQVTSRDTYSESLQGGSNIEIQALSFADAAYEDMTGECPVDLGVQLGRMRIMERIGGYHHPKLIQQLDSILHEVQHRCGVKLPQPATAGYDRQTASTYPSYLYPGLDYLSPSNGFFFSSSESSSARSETGFLNRDLCQNILKHYWGAVHIIAKCVHRPSFERQWENFWISIETRSQLPASLEAVVMAVLLCGTIATPDLNLASSFGVKKTTLIDDFKRATESALARAKIIHTTNLETLQAFVIYLISICRAQLSKEHVVLLNLGITIAESMGLHRDPALYGLGWADIHVRRLLWHQLCFLDLRSCEAHKIRPQIREDEFDTSIVEQSFDRSLDSVKTLHEGESTWTDTTFSIMNFECSVIYRVIWVARPKLEKKLLDLNTVLGWVMDFRRNMTRKYEFLDEDIPIQKYTKLVLGVLIAKLFSMVLLRYHRPINSKLPERLYQILIDQSIHQLSNIMVLETAVELQPWAWHVSAWNLYRSALVLLEEVSLHPDMPKRDKMWRILDYVFLQPPGLTPDQKSLDILTQGIERLSVYRNLKRMRVPAGPNFGFDTSSEGAQSYNPQIAPREASLNGMPLIVTHVNQAGSDLPYPEDVFYSSSADIDTIADIDLSLWDQMFLEQNEIIPTPPEQIRM